MRMAQNDVWGRLDLPRGTLVARDQKAFSGTGPIQLTASYT